MMNRLLFLFFSLAVIFLESCESKPIFVFSSHQPLVAFLSDKAPNQIYLYDLSHNSQKSIKINGLLDSSLITNYHWLDNKDQWIIEALTDNGSDLFISEKGSSKLTNLTNTPDVFESDFQVSPDQDLVAYSVAMGSTNTFIEIMDLRSKKRWQIGKSGFFERSPCWLDNATLIVESSRVGSPNIFQVNIYNNDWKNLSKGQGIDTGFSLANEAKIMAFLSDRNGGWKPFIYSFVSQETYGPIGDFENVSSLVLSPDGTWLILNLAKDNRYEVILYNVENKILKKVLSSNKNPTTNLQWSKDSKWVVFSSALQSEQVDLYVYSVESDSIINVTKSPERELNAKWVYSNENSYIFRVFTSWP